MPWKKVYSHNEAGVGDGGGSKDALFKAIENGCALRVAVVSDQYRNYLTPTSWIVQHDHVVALVGQFVLEWQKDEGWWKLKGGTANDPSAVFQTLALCTNGECSQLSRDTASTSMPHVKQLFALEWFADV